MEAIANNNDNNNHNSAYFVLSLAELESLVQAIKEKRGDNKAATVVLRSNVIRDTSGNWQFRSCYRAEV